MVLLTGLVALAMALVHIFGSRLRFLDVIPRSRWLSASSGAAVAYLFLYLLPRLEEHQEMLVESGHALAELVRHPVYAMALLGLVTFYGLERTTKQARENPRVDTSRSDNTVFWIHMGSFAVYNLIFGYLLMSREEAGELNLLLYALAIGLHFLVNDYGLRQDHQEAYHGIGRWLLAGAVLLGWLLGVLISLPQTPIALVFAFIAGGAVLNVLKEELPEERKSRFSAFLVGAAGYALLIVLVEQGV